jgi:hypothetical protein
MILQAAVAQLDCAVHFDLFVFLRRWFDSFGARNFGIILRHQQSLQFSESVTVDPRPRKLVEIQ